MKTADFDFPLPKDLIALRPSEKRDDSRLLVLHRNGNTEHRNFSDIIEYILEGDMLLLNNTKVFPARIFAEKKSGGKLDMLLVRETDNDCTWEIICRGRVNGTVTIGGSVLAEIWTERVQKPDEGTATRKFIKFLGMGRSEVTDMLWQHGQMPLPPYIKRMPDKEDKSRYQTVYAEELGSIAAPTAGLHFTEELLQKVREKGVLIRSLTLHVGTGTFKPIKSESIKDHVMDCEHFEIKNSLLDEVKRVKESGRKIVTVGTTSTRAIEGYVNGNYVNSPLSAKAGNGRATSYSRGSTGIFIYPGYEFRVADSLITNFHLPGSTPLMLASALCGFERLLEVYREAIAMGYRFFSYGDAMLIL